MKTIDVKFEIAQLPRWARQFEIFLLAEKDLAYRCNVFSAKTKHLQKVLLKIALQKFSK